MSNLVYLDLSHNRISQLAAGVFGRLTALDTLNLAGNRLKSFPTTALKSSHKIRILRLDLNAITGYWTVMLCLTN